MLAKKIQRTWSYHFDKICYICPRKSPPQWHLLTQHNIINWWEGIPDDVYYINASLPLMLIQLPSLSTLAAVVHFSYSLTSILEYLPPVTTSQRIAFASLHLRATRSSIQFHPEKTGVSRRSPVKGDLTTTIYFYFFLFWLAFFPLLA